MSDSSNEPEIRGELAKKILAEKAGMKFCPSCGTESRDDLKFCTDCGTPFPKKKSHTAVIVLFSIAAFCLLLIIWINAELNSGVNQGTDEQEIGWALLFPTLGFLITFIWGIAAAASGNSSEKSSEIWKCPKCEAENIGLGWFCSNCGIDRREPSNARCYGAIP